MTASELYHKAFPHYLAMGMTWEQFWEQDSSLVKDYREAQQLRMDQINYTAWLNGLYVYEALCNASPLFRSFSRSGTRAGPYPEKPHEFERKEHLTPEQENDRKEKAGMAAMEAIAAKFNQSFFQRQKTEEAKKLMDENTAEEPHDNIEGKEVTKDG